MHECFLAMTLLSGGDMCSRAISSHEASHNLTLHQSPTSPTNDGSAQYCSTHGCLGSASQLAAESIGGADVHKYADNQTSARSGAEIERASGRCGSAMRRATRLEVD